MTHDELLAKINPNNTTNQETYLAPYNALRAVVELHKPEGNDTQQCKHDKKIYPCTTIQAIEKAIK
jgi:hypothetical protein